MITVTISINTKVILARSARRVETGETNIYHVDDGRILEHKYEDGAIALVKQMLEGIQEP